MRGTTWISSQTNVSGQIETSGSLLIDGHVEGTVRATDAVTVSATGVVIAHVLAKTVEIRGQVFGNVDAKERIDVLAGAKVNGDLRSPIVNCAPGVELSGQIDSEPRETPPTKKKLIRRSQKHVVPSISKEEPPGKKRAVLLPRVGKKARLVRRRW